MNITALSEEEIINALKSFLDEKIPNINKDGNDNKNDNDNKNGNNNNKYNDDIEKQLANREKLIQKFKEKKERQINNVAVNNYSIKPQVTCEQLTSSILAQLQPPMHPPMFRPLPPPMYTQLQSQMLQQLPPSASQSQTIPQELINTGFKRKRSNSLDFNNNNSMNQFTCNIEDFHKLCKFCECYGRNVNHELKFCSFLCTNEQCLNKTIHPKYRCTSQNKHDITRIEYNTKTFLTHKFIIRDI